VDLLRLPTGGLTPRIVPNASAGSPRRVAPAAR
jgi:hypothetical protein